jgi:ATP-binding cassette, subfamily B, multidrug efflux pump
MATPLRRLLPYHSRYKVPFWAGMTSLLIARVFEALIPLFLRDGVDAVIAGREQIAQGTIDAATAQGYLALPALAIGACVLARFTFIVYARRVIRRIGNYVAYDLRKRIYDHLQLQGVAFFSRHPTGDLMARAINDINLVRELIASGLRTIVVIIFASIIALLAMLWLAPTLTLLLLLPMPVIGVLGYFAARRVYERSIRVQEGFSNLSEQVQGNLYGIRTVQALVQEEHEIGRFDRVSSDYVDRYMALTRYNSFIRGLMPWLGAFSTLIILGYGGSLVMSGHLTVGTFTAFFAYVGMVLWPVREAGQMVTLWQRGASGTARLYEILDTPPEITDRPEPNAPQPIRGSISLRALRYAFPGASEETLRGIDLEIPAGETVAIMGRVGAGKSTLLNCFVRLLDPPPGSVLIDGWDVRAYALDQLRRQVVLVPQDPFLFAEILRHNLSYDDPDRDEGLIWRAVDDADLYETVKSFIQELDTPVGERGVTLSGGQKQRSTLARGLVRHAPVLILDDCFSSVDTETEEHILERLFSARRGLTTLMVSNRVSTARHADRIVVMENGAIAEVGSHADLLRAGGLYAELDQLQKRRMQAGLALAEDSATDDWDGASDGRNDG